MLPSLSYRVTLLQLVSTRNSVDFFECTQGSFQRPGSCWRCDRSATTFLSQWSVTTPNLAAHRRKVHSLIGVATAFSFVVQLGAGNSSGRVVRDRAWTGREMEFKKKLRTAAPYPESFIFRNFPSKMECFGTSGWSFKEGIHITYTVRGNKEALSA